MERELPQLLREPNSWNSLWVNYHPPFVERLWRSWGDGCRIYLHRIHPCFKSEALFHPHPWPSVIKVCSDSGYEMGVTYGHQNQGTAITLELAGGSVYEMLDPLGWHYVRPTDKPSLSIMVTGKPWPFSLPNVESPTKPLEPLSIHQAMKLMDDFLRLYPLPDSL